MHQPVLACEVVELMRIRAGGVYLDGTLGSGGHASLILDAAGPEGRLIGIDRDGEALARAAARLAPRAKQCVFRKGNFADIGHIVAAAGFSRLDGVLLDLGVSSEQLEDAARGFSIQQEGPLDMRMDRTDAASAADLLATLSEAELAELIRKYGEDPDADRIARSLVRAREAGDLRTTADLARIVAAAKGGRHMRMHPATRTFQAIRIAVNRELEAIEQALPQAMHLLAPGGRLAVIAFHSLEDRIVKTSFREHVGRWENLAGGGRRWVVCDPEMVIVNRKPITPTETEMHDNPRSRSAKLRVAERRG